MSAIGQSVLEFNFFRDAPPTIIGTLVTGQTVNIELWDNGVLVDVSSSGCGEIGNTGRYSWSTSGTPPLTSSRQQYHWRMSDGSNTDEGDFVLISYENKDGGMPSLSDQSDYLV